MHVHVQTSGRPITACVTARIRHRYGHTGRVHGHVCARVRRTVCRHGGVVAMCAGPLTCPRTLTSASTCLNAHSHTRLHTCLYTDLGQARPDPTTSAPSIVPSNVPSNVPSKVPFEGTFDRTFDRTFDQTVAELNSRSGRRVHVSPCLDTCLNTRPTTCLTTPWAGQPGSDDGLYSYGLCSTACVVMAYIVMAYVVMARPGVGPPRSDDGLRDGARPRPFAVVAARAAGRPV